MRKIQIYIIIFCFLLIVLNFNNAIANDNITKDIASAAKYDKGFRFNIQGWIYLHIEGEPYDRGYQHGYLLAGEIIDIINRWRNIFPLKKLSMFHLAWLGFF